MNTFICIVCHEEKLLSEFYPDLRLLRGHKSVCKVCLNNRSIAWRKAHPEKAQVISRRWRENHPDKVAENNRRPRERIYNPVKSKAWREKRLQDPAYRNKINKAARERAQMIRDWISAYKISVGCIDCGYKGHHAALEFDHVSSDKKINVCNAKSVGQAQVEISKCVVRCSNCHRIRTWERLQDRKLA